MFHNLADIAKSMDYPLKTVEMFEPNDYYGNAKTLKFFAGIPESYDIKAVIAHGMTIDDTIWDHEKKCDFPSYIAYSTQRCNVLRKHTNKALFSIGPYIAYAEGYLQKDAFDAFKKSLGRTLLVFPPHSTHWIDVQCEHDSFISEIKNIGKNFDNVLICIYWKDVLRDMQRIFRKNGFLCTTAGHIYDNQFLKRIRTIIELSDQVISSSFGTHFLYSLYFKKPFYYIPQKQSYSSNRKDIQGPHKDSDRKDLEIAKVLTRLFSKFETYITQEQTQFLSEFAGFEDVKSSHEMKVIISTIEDMYHARKQFSQKKNFFYEYLTKYITNIEFSNRELIMNQYNKNNCADGEVNEFFLHQNVTARKRMLNLGCGRRIHPAWINVDFISSSPDVIAQDLGKGLSFESNTYEAVYHSHLLEHFPKEHAPVFLAECFRVLQPGGIIRVVVPDLETIVRLYLILLQKSLQGDEEAKKRYEWIMLELFDQMVRNHSGGAMLDYWRQNPMPAEDFVIQRLGSEVKEAIVRIRSNPNSDNQSSRRSLIRDPHKIGQFRFSGEVHQWMYDRYSLGKLLREAGFEDIKICKADESRIPEFNSYLLDIEADGSVRKPDSLFVEAIKFGY